MKENSLIDNAQTTLEYWDQVCQMLNFWYLVHQKKKKKKALIRCVNCKKKIVICYNTVLSMAHMVISAKKINFFITLKLDLSPLFLSLSLVLLLSSTLSLSMSKKQTYLSHWFEAIVAKIAATHLYHCHHWMNLCFMCFSC